MANPKKGNKLQPTLTHSKWRIPIIIILVVFAILIFFYIIGSNSIKKQIIFTLPVELPEATAGILYSPYSFCQPDSARSGATCGGLAGETTDPTGGNPAYSFSVKFGSGFIPPGLTLELNGLLKGTPTLPGYYTFGICAKDLKNNEACKTTSITVKAQDGMPVRGEITDKDTGNLVGGAIVKVAYQDGSGIDNSIIISSSEASIDSDGNNYLMYLPYYLPENVIIGVNLAGYLPASKNVVVDASLEQEGKYRKVDFKLTPISEKVIVIDNQLHHLGDDSYTGAVNSQFQLSAEGSQYSNSFTINEQQLKYSKASLIITNKGTQELLNLITLNGQNIGGLCCSSSDGSFEMLRWEFDASILKKGLNQITINSAFDSSIDDYDDFEFTDIMIELEL